MAWESFRIGSGTLQMIQELCKPVWVVQKQPANHCLKPRGPAINRSLGTTGATTGAVATSTHPVQLVIVEELLIFQPGQCSGLGICTYISDNRFMEGI